MTAPHLAFDVALLSAAALGFRHGFDFDHVAAITDIAGVQADSRSAMRMGLLYALGHAATVAALGLAAIAFRVSLPAGVDSWMERLVGITLLLLGAVVLWTTLFRPRAHSHAPRTRVILLVNGLLWCVWKVRCAFSSQPPPRAELFSAGIGKAPALLVGVIHGLGAETPTQLMVFLLAANLGGLANGLLGLATFIAGMLVMNTLICAAAAGMFRLSHRRPRVFEWAAGLSAAYSMIVGLVFLAGTSSFSSIFASFLAAK